MKKILLTVLFLFLFSGICYASDTDFANDILYNTDFSEIEAFLEDDYPQLDFKSMINTMINEKKMPGIDMIKEILKNTFFKEIRYAVILSLKIASVCIIMAFLKDMPGIEGGAGGAAFFISQMIVSFILLDCFRVGLDSGKTVIKNVNSFVNMSIPLLTVFLAGSGAANTAACVSPVMLIGIEVISLITEWIFIPLIISLGILPVFSNQNGPIGDDLVTDTIKTVLKWGMGLVFSLFGGIVNIYGNFAASTDALGFKAAKYVAGSALPVVGNLISEGMGTFYYSCSVVKNAFGAVLMCIIFIIVLAPAVKLFVLNLVLNVTAMFAGAVCEKSISLKIKEISGSLMYVFSLICLMAFLFIICIAIIIHTSNNVVI